jgi:SOS-response transcriptional repressor LexA
MDSESLKKMTVAQLREKAKKISGTKGISSMKKDDLIDLLARQSPESSGVKPAKEQSVYAPKKLSKSEIKKQIRALKEKKRDALAQRDRSQAKYYTRQIHLFKHQLRRLARDKAKVDK